MRVGGKAFNVLRLPDGSGNGLVNPVNAESILRTALEAGFDFAGLAPAGPAPHASAFRDWIARGGHGSMAWLARDVERRTNLRTWDSTAAAVLVVGLGYAVSVPDPSLWNDPRRGRIARYAWGPDYHDRMGSMLRGLAGHIRCELGMASEPRMFLDTAPVLERDWAAATGMGFQGRSTMFIQPAFGTYAWLGGLTVPFAPEEFRFMVRGEARASPALGDTAPRECPPGCANCIQACPTGALGEPHRVDARRCLSYWTIEQRGVIPPELASRMDRRIFGCDACQETCPWNGSRARTGGASWIRFEPDLHAPVLEEAMNITETEFKARYHETPVWRVRWQGFVRNAVAAWAAQAGESARPRLAHLSAHHAHPLVRAQAVAMLQCT